MFVLRGLGRDKSNNVLRVMIENSLPPLADDLVFFQGRQD
jgi:hypothetical protein